MTVMSQTDESMARCPHSAPPAPSLCRRMHTTVPVVTILLAAGDVAMTITSKPHVCLPVASPVPGTVLYPWLVFKKYISNE